MKLRSITITGLKGHDQSLTFERPVAVLVGENGAGKTEVLQALSLLATGSTAGVGKTGDAIMRLSRGDSIEIRAALAEACKRGVVDQCFVAGCPDEVDEPPEGCEVFRLGGAA